MEHNLNGLSGPEEGIAQGAPIRWESNERVAKLYVVQNVVRRDACQTKVGFGATQRSPQGPQLPFGRSPRMSEASLDRSSRGEHATAR